MRTMRIVELGRPLEMAEVPEPVPGPGEVLVRVRACGLNFADTLMAAGRYQEKPPLPFAPGLEVCGTVAALGPGVTAPVPGSRVAGLCGAGGLAEFVALPAAACAPVPDALADEAAAGFLVAYGTSHVALALLARLRPGETLLVTGASGGVGLTAVELGALIGARVVAVARGAEKRAVAAAAGAALTLDAEDDIAPALKALGGADVVYDTVGGAALRRLPARGEARGAAAADRVRRRRRAADRGEPPAGEEPDGLRPLLQRLGARCTRRRRAPASTRSSPGTRWGASPARRPGAGARGGQRRARPAQERASHRQGRGADRLSYSAAIALGAAVGLPQQRASPSASAARGPCATYMLIR